MLVPWNFLPSALRYFEIVAYALFASAQVRSVLHREMFPCLKQLLLANFLVCVIFFFSFGGNCDIIPPTWRGNDSSQTHECVNFFCQSGGYGMLGDGPRASHPGLSRQWCLFQHICPWEDVVSLPWSGVREECWVIRKPVPSGTCLALVVTEALPGRGNQCCGQGKMLFKRKPNFDPTSCAVAESFLSGDI